MTGLATATILGGVAGLTSCDEHKVPGDISAQETTIPATTLEPASQDQIDRVNAAESGIEEFFKDKKDNFDMNYLSLEKFYDFDNYEEGYSYSLMLTQLADENISRTSLATVSFKVDKNLFDQVYALYKNGSSNIKENVDVLGEIVLEMYNDAIKDGHNADIMELIYNEIKTNQNFVFLDYEAEMAD